MSHVATVKVEIQDFQALERACHNLGLVVNWNQKTYRWFGRHVGDYPLPAGFKASDLGKCNHAISIPDDKFSYEIGICTNPQTGKTELLWDFYRGGFGLLRKVGPKCQKLIYEYAKEVTRGQIASQFPEWSVSEEYNEETGETIFKLRDYS